MGGLAEAEQVLTDALTRRPAALRYKALSWRAMVLLATDRPHEALADATRAAELAPDSPLARGNLAVVLFFNNQPHRAEREARAAER